MAERIQRLRTKGWRMPDGAIYVGRPGPWGNLFTVQGAIEAGVPQEWAKYAVVEAFEDWLARGDLSEYWHEDTANQWLWMRRNLHSLYGKTLACWCPLHEPCHANVLLVLARKAAPWPAMEAKSDPT